MKYNINCIYNYYDTLLSEWGEWNKNILVGTFPGDASNLTEALGIVTSDGRSRAKELFRIGLLTQELTKGMQALNSVKLGKNLQSRLGFITALIYQGYTIGHSPKMRMAISALNAVFSIVQSINIEKLAVSINTIIYRLLDCYHVPCNYDRITWLRYLISGFCCELKEAKNGSFIIDFIKGENKEITLRIIDNKSKDIRCSFRNVEDLKGVINQGVSLTNIHHQKMALFLLGSVKDSEPRGFYGIADKYFRDFLHDCYDIEKANIDDSPFKGLYYDEENSLCKKSSIIETLKNISCNYPQFAKSYNSIMKSIEEGAIEALMYMTDKPKSTFISNWEPPKNIQNNSPVLNYITAIRTKPFLLLAGISGTGKSRIVREFAFKSCPKYLQDKAGTTPGNYCMIEVKPNWHDSTELLGYYSNLSRSYQFKKFVKFLVKAKMHPEVPFFVCLDEMNLAPVEQYFAEILSVLETRKHPKDTVTGAVNMSDVKTEVIVESQYFKELTWTDKDSTTHQRNDMTDKDWYDYFFDTTTMNEEEKEQILKYQYSRTLQTEGLTLPDNVVIIGTVNMDDTTHQFSRKVIDRAMTIEMNGGNLRNMFGGSKDLEYLPETEQKTWQKAFTRRYVTADEVLDAHPDVASKLMNALPARLEEINKALKGTPFEVSYRVLNELTIMVGVMLDANNDGKGLDDIINHAMNDILLMKILPRIEGDAEMFTLSKAYKEKMGVSYSNRLEWLKALAPDIQAYRDSVQRDYVNTERVENVEEFKEHSQTAKDKIQEMIDRLNNQDFTRFWP